MHFLEHYRVPDRQLSGMLCVKEINPSLPRGYQPCSIPSLQGVEFLVDTFNRTVNWVQVGTAIANYVAILSVQ